MKYFEDIFAIQYCKERRNIVDLTLKKTGLIKPAAVD